MHRSPRRPTRRLVLCLTLGASVLACDAPESEESETSLDQLQFNEVPDFEPQEVGLMPWRFGAEEEPTEVAYEVQGDHVVVGGDMVLGTISEVRQILVDAQFRGAFTSSHIAGWPDDRIDYFINGDVTPADEQRIEDAIERWESASTFRFVERSQIWPGVHTLVFRAQTGGFPPKPPCQAQVGYRGTGMQSIWLTPNVCSTGSITHEIGHALGLMHEHQRPDRDDHISVHYNNMDIWDQANFWPTGYAWGEYEPRSLMHYQNDSFALTDDVFTILLDGCTDDTGTNADGVSCNVGSNGRPKASDVAAAIRANDGPDPSAFRLRNDNSEDCLRPSFDGMPHAGDSAYTSSSCSTTSSSRRWYVKQRSDGSRVLVNKMGRVCLSSGDDVSVQRCDDAPELEFELYGLGGNAVQIRQGGRCLRDQGGTLYMSNSCADTPTRRWFMDG